MKKKKLFLLAVLMMVMGLCFVACSGPVTDELGSTFTESPTEESQTDDSSEDSSKEEVTDRNESESETNQNKKPQSETNQNKKPQSETNQNKKPQSETNQNKKPQSETNQNKEPESENEHPSNEQEPTLPTEKPTVKASLPKAYGKNTANVIYAGDDDSKLYTFKKKNATDFEAACKYYTDNGYTVYRSTDKAGNLFTTFTNGTAMAHVYWFKALSEMNIVISDTAASSLPPVKPAIVDGDVNCTIVQLEDFSHNNGMSYVIQLKDGSYIVYDGSYSTQAQLLLNYLKDNHKGEGKPIVRAWVMTHSHNDHYPTFSQIARTSANQIQVEYVLINPLNDKNFTLDSEQIYLSSTTFQNDVAKFSGAKLVYVHTGMEFVFCNLTMEVLWTPDDLYKSESNRNINFNNTSIVTRLYDANYSALFTGDIGKKGTDMMGVVYGNYLKSDVCQVAHHGVEDVPFSFYDIVRAPLLFYPCDYDLYDNNTRHLDVRLKLEKTDYTKEILIQGLGRYVRAWGTTYAADAPLSIPDYTPSKNHR